MNERTAGAICLGPYDNVQGGYTFMKLSTGKVVVRNKFTHIPMTEEVIQRVMQIARDEKMSQGLNIVTKYDDQITGVYEEDENEELDNEDAVDEEDVDIYDYLEEEETSLNYVKEDREHETFVNENNNIYEMIEEVEETLDNAVEELEHIENNEDEQEKYTTRSGRISEKPERYTPSFKGTTYEYNNIMLAMNYVMQQYSLKKGLEKFGERGDKAAYAEMEQQHLRNSFIPVLPKDISPEKRKRVLESLMLITEKDNGEVKGRNCANGSTQRQHIKKEETASPTVKLESIFLTAVIDAKEGRDIATVDIPNAFIQTKVEKEEDKVIMRMRGRLAEYLEMIAPEIYSPYIMIEKGKKVLYCEAQNAIYGTLKAALLFYKKLRKDLEKMGFEFNRYDPCVANRYENNVQQTVVFHVDDMKISCIDKKENDKIIQNLRTLYEVEGLKEMKVCRGKIHKIL